MGHQIFKRHVLMLTILRIAIATIYNNKNEIFTALVKYI